MSSAVRGKPPSNKDYPTSDGRPVAESDFHRNLLFDLVHALEARYADDSQVYVSGSLLVYYVPGERFRYVSPDVFVVKGVPEHDRINYLTWEEGKGPDLVIELTSSSTRYEDVQDKFMLYERTLRVPEYFLFDPMGDYLDPPLRSYRLRQGSYRAIRATKGRLPSRVLGLHLERVGRVLRLFDPATGKLLPTPTESIRQAQVQAERAEARVEHAESEMERLREELEALRRRLGGGNGSPRA